MVLSKKGKLTALSSDAVVISIDTFAPVQLNEEMYIQTVPHGSCQIIVNGAKCSQCVASVECKTGHLTKPTHFQHQLY